MSDYADKIDTNEFNYRRPVYYTNPFSVYVTDITTKLTLNSENFNFDLSKDDGSDFRLLSGIDTLKMWKAYWSKDNKQAVLFFKIPSVGAGCSVEFHAYWGNQSAADISDPDSMNLLFYESFDGPVLNTSKWNGNTNAGSTEYGYLFSLNNSFTSITNPLNNKSDWIMEAGIYADLGSGTITPSYRAIGFEFIGTENNFFIEFMITDHIRHNASAPAQASTEELYQTDGGLEFNSYHEIYIDYRELTDRITVKLKNRNTFNDVEYKIQRKVEEDTRLSNVRCRGAQVSQYSGGYPVYISWLILREYNDISLNDLDGRDMYVPYENIKSQSQDFSVYQPDFTTTYLQHETVFGGDPYLISEGGYDSDTNVWVSDNVEADTEVSLTFHTGWISDITNSNYIHYDSSHLYYYGASKLSNNNTDRMKRNDWKATSTSGWAAIKFPESVFIGSFRIKAASNLSACPKRFTFYGSYTNPALNFDNAIVLIEGTFERTTEWQSRMLPSVIKCEYYVLHIYDTYDNANIDIQEWEMMVFLAGGRKKYPSQLRLHPALYDNWVYNFPKEISLQGSIDNITWITLLPWTKTYTPFIEHYEGDGYWQKYSFRNNFGSWSFRLLCKGNWRASNNKIIIGEWSLHELEEEKHTYRILDGSTNNIQQIWASDLCNIANSNGILYIANDRISKISNSKMVKSIEMPSYYEDFVV